MTHDEDLLRATDDGDECPLCECGTVIYEHGEVRCRGECGSSVELSLDESIARNRHQAMVHLERENNAV